MGERVRVVAYVRVSTDKQAEQGLSLEAQRAKLAVYGALYELALVAVEVDAGVSAKTLQRSALQRALQRLKAGEAEALLVVKLDRLTRSVRDLGALVETYFLAGKWSLMSVSEQIDTRTAAGHMVLNILAAVSQWEREAIGERTAEAMAYKRRRREYTGGEPPYGWRRAADGVHRRGAALRLAARRRRRPPHSPSRRANHSPGGQGAQSGRPLIARHWRPAGRPRAAPPPGQDVESQNRPRLPAGGGGVDGDAH